MSLSQRITLRQLRIFEAAARHLHFGRAAAEVHVTQPAVSIQLKQLEADVGMPLFEQAGRRIHLTRVGTELAGHARAVLARMREADEAMQALQQGGGELHIAATTTAEYFAPHLLAAFRRDRPGLKVRLLVSNRDAVVRQLSDNTVDLAIMGRAPRALDTTAVPFARHPLAFVASPAHRLARRRRLRLAQLAGETFLVREHGSGTRAAMEAVCLALGFQPSETLEVGPNEAIKQAVIAGMGIGFISLHTVGLELATDRLAALAVAGTPIMRDWFVVHRRQKRLPPAAAAFKDLLVADGARLVRQALA
jgi:LysR family transcriptional regulator, low CO2-responsive transcriptional regulator